MSHILLIPDIIGKCDEAVVYYKEDLDASRSILGNTHPDTLVSISNMGDVLQAQGDLNYVNLIWLQFKISLIYCNIYTYIYLSSI